MGKGSLFLAGGMGKGSLFWLGHGKGVLYSSAGTGKGLEPQVYRRVSM